MFLGRLGLPALYFSWVGSLARHQDDLQDDQDDQDDELESPSHGKAGLQSERKLEMSDMMSTPFLCCFYQSLSVQIHTCKNISG